MNSLGWSPRAAVNDTRRGGYNPEPRTQNPEPRTQTQKCHTEPQGTARTLSFRRFQITNAWTSGSVDEFVSAGYRVLLLANDDTGLAYSLYDFCGGHEELTVDYIDTLPDASRLINGLTIYGNDYFLRSYSEQLRYISLSAAGALTEAFPVFLDADSISKYVRWNLNLIATDNVDGAKMKAQAWSWAENEPSTTESGAYVLMDTTGRWVASTTAAQTSRACWNSSTVSWSIVAFAETCADGTTFSAPADPYQNYLLSTALAAQGITDTSVVINASLAL